MPINSEDTSGADANNIRARISKMNTPDAADLLDQTHPRLSAEILQEMNPGVAADILEEMEDSRRKAVVDAANPDHRSQWTRNEHYPEDTVGRLMEPPLTILRPDQTIAEAVEAVKELAHATLVTYLYVVDDGGRLLGLVTMRDLLLSDNESRLGDVMAPDPFSLSPEMELPDAMKLVVSRHFPIYPVVDSNGVLVGLVRGRVLFEEQAYEISAQPGRMVGVDKEERLSTPWTRSLKFRHPWLQLNLLTAFIAATVVGVFQGTIDKFVILAAFLPVLAGQSGNTGCQALAVALRGLTLGELEPGKERALVMKEGLLGLFNGMLVGLTAGVGMFIAASAQHASQPLVLSTIVFAAMVGSCVVSGISGATIPLLLRKLGADPATASSIFLTTATDVVSMGLFLSLATIFLR